MPSILSLEAKMFVVRACRGCLRTTGRLHKITEPYKRMYAAVTGFQIKDGDGYPTFFCVECSMQMKKCLAFRRKIRRAFFCLQEIMALKKQVCVTDLEKVNRVQAGLNSTYGIWNPLNIGFFTINELETKATEIPYSNTEAPELNLDFKINPGTKGYKYNIDIVNNYNDTEINKMTPEVNNTCVLINIKQDNCQEKEELGEHRKTNIEEELNLEDLLFHDDIDSIRNDELFFQNLRQDITGDVSEKEQAIVLSGTTKDTHKPIVNRIQQICRALPHAMIKVLSPEEQRTAFLNRMNAELLQAVPLKCDVCLTVFENTFSLMQHVIDHSESTNNNLACAICHKSFATEQQLHRHGSDEHWYEFTCKHCNETSNTISDFLKCYEKHYADFEPQKFQDYFKRTVLPTELMYQTLIRYSGPPSDHVCLHCNIGFSSHSSLVKHMSRHIQPLNKKRHKCDICGIYSMDTKLRYMRRHMEAWHMYSYTCVLCGAVLMNRAQAREHKNTLHKHSSHKPPPAPKRRRRKKDFTCEYCGKSCRNQAAYKKHRKEQHLAETYRHHCNLCGLPFPSAGDLYHHQLVDHGYISISDPKIGDPQFTCVQCNVQFVNQSSYYVHLLQLGHDESADIELACPPCKKLFDSRKEWEDHEKTCNAGLYPQQCRYCDEVLPNAKMYVKHYESQHPGLKYRHDMKTKLCELCAKWIPTSSMRSHKKSHIKQMNEAYQCKFCSTKFTSAKLYINHVLCNHAPTPYHCALCPKQFKFRFTCRDHILKVHAPETLYKCEICAQRFAHTDFLQDHSSDAHGIKLKETGNRRPTKGKRIFVYPHMKIDGSLIGARAFEQIDLQVCDYLDENNRPVKNFRDYVKFDLKPVVKKIGK